jgi:hypothetical protein
MYKFTYKDKKTGKNVYSHIELHNQDLILVGGVKTTDINPATKPDKTKLKSK